MTEPKPSSRNRLDGLRQAALGIALLWACWITALGLASGLRQSMSLGETLLHAAFPGLAFLASVFVAWRWAMVGGVVLMIAGAVSLIYYPFFVAIPAVTAGVLLLAWRIRQP